MKYIAVGFLFLAGCSHWAPRDLPPPPIPSSRTEALMRFELEPGNLAGTTEEGQRIGLGGFSGLRYLGLSAEGDLRFLTVTDRGPNSAEFEEGGETFRPFALPGYQPKIIYLRAELKSKKLKIEKIIPLLRPDGTPITGRPRRKGIEVAVDSHGARLPIDPYGMDPEGIVYTPAGEYWISEEYGPSVSLFSAEGKMLELLKPGEGLPKVFEQIRLNRGFEGLAASKEKLFAMLQSPLDNPRSEKQKNSARSSLVRIVEIDLRLKQTSAQYAYPLQLEETDKIGDIAVDGEGRLLVVEQNGREGAKGRTKVYRYSLAGATNLQLLPERVAGPGGSLELLSAKEREADGIHLGKKEEVLDLRALGIGESKIEGIDLVDGNSLAVIADNDFGIDGNWKRKSGTFGLKDEKPALYIMPLKK